MLHFEKHTTTGMDTFDNVLSRAKAHIDNLPEKERKLLNDQLEHGLGLSSTQRQMMSMV